MGYIEKNVLTAGETIKIVPTKNSAILVLKWVWGILGCWLLLIPTIQAIVATVKFKNTEYVVTSKRVIEKSGWVSTHTDDMQLSKIENITVNYTFWSKIFNCGTLTIQGTNRNHVSFVNIKDAERIKKEINNLII
ncbi:MAG: PH domain-containing protein [Clostridia bacterium]|nr:PH domain-containing protein [Clostridia bacterium]